MTVGAVLREGVEKLRAAGIEGAARDARLLMAACLDVEPGRLTLMADDPMDKDACRTFHADVADRIARKPVSRILGRRLFWGRSFIVTEDVLDPRPETETLIALALAAPFGSVLDLGTGSGCIVTTLLAERAGTHGLGTDISLAALDVARRNAGAHDVLDRLQLQPSDWFRAVDGRYDLIVSNPPYIAPAERDSLSAEVLNHDPALALFCGVDGLDAYRAIAARAADHLTPGGRLMVEIGWTQGPAVADLFRQGGLQDVTIHPDLDGRDRVVSGRCGG